MSARAVIAAVAGGVIAVAAAAGAYFFLWKKDGAGPLGAITSPADPASFEGEDAVDTLAVETPPGDIPAPDGAQVEGDPWLDPGAMDPSAEPIEGSGDFVEGEPFEDVFDPGADVPGAGEGPVADPIDPAEKDPSEEPAETSDPGR